MSYTESSYETGTEYTESTENDTTTNEEHDTTTTTQNETDQNGASTTNPEEEEHKEQPPPEPEVDPLEGITYDDDPNEELPAFGDLSYWEEHYSQDQEATEWYLDPRDIKDIIEEYAEKEGTKVLVKGTGTCVLAPALAKDGFESVTGIDFSPSAIKKMRKNNRGDDAIENLSYRVMDCRDMQYEDGSYTLIVDKATMDCIFQAGEKDVKQYVAEIARLLPKKGVFICVSNIEPEIYEVFFNRQLDLQITLEKVIEKEKPIKCERPYYVYIVRKTTKLLL